MLPLFATSRLDALVLNAAYVIWILPEVVSSFVHHAAPNAQTDDRASSVVILICVWGGTFAAYALAFAAPAFAIAWQRPLLFGAGVLLMLGGVAFRWYSIRVLGKYFTRQVSVQPGQTVVESGPYRLIRHPSYTGTLVTMLGLGLALTNWLSLNGVMLFAFVGYSYRARVEEAVLVKALGEPYRQYMKRTKRFIPFLY